MHMARFHKQHMREPPCTVFFLFRLKLSIKFHVSAQATARIKETQCTSTLLNEPQNSELPSTIALQKDKWGKKTWKFLH